MQRPHDASAVWRRIALVALAGCVVLGASNIYLLRSLPQPSTAAADIANLARATQSAGASEPVLTSRGADGVDTMIAKLESRLQSRPGDAEGWRMLGWSYFNTQRYNEAAEAYAKALGLEPGNADYRSSYGEALVQAAGGVVTPGARQLFDEVLRTEAGDNRSRFYVALAEEQAGHTAAAFERWSALLAAAPPDAEWLTEVRQHLAATGKAMGRESSTPLADISPAEMTPSTIDADQHAAIDGMIAGLREKLQRNPADRDGWVMMIRSLAVRGDRAGAAQGLRDALAAFAGDPPTRLQIEAIARSLGMSAEPSDAAAAANQVTADGP